jgi:hypothetical protein
VKEDISTELIYTVLSKLFQISKCRIHLHYQSCSRRCTLKDYNDKSLPNRYIGDAMLQIVVH